MPDSCGIACGNAAVFPRECGIAGVAVLSPMGEPHTATQPPQPNKPATADRWRIVVALLRAPERESHRLARLLEALPVERHRHECADDVKRRPGAGRSVPLLGGGGSKPPGLCFLTGRLPSLAMCQPANLFPPEA